MSPRVKRTPLRMENLPKDALRHVADDQEIEISGKVLSAGDLRKLLANRTEMLKKLPDTTIMKGRGLATIAKQLKLSVATAESRRSLHKQETRLKVEGISEQLNGELQNYQLARLRANQAALSELPILLTGSPLWEDLRDFTIPPFDGPTTAPEIGFVIGAGYETQGRFWPGMTMWIAGCNFGDQPGHVYMEATSFDGSPVEIELIRESFGNVDWTPFWLLMTIPTYVRGLLRQNIGLKIVRADGVEGMLSAGPDGVPFEPTKDVVHLSKDISRTMQITCGDGGFLTSDDCYSNSGATAAGSHHGIGSATDRCEMPALLNGWKIKNHHFSDDGGGPPGFNSETVNSGVLDEDTLIRFSVSWDIGGFSGIPILGGLFPIYGWYGWALNIWIYGPIGVPFE